MPFQLTTFVLGSNGSTVLSESDYKALLKARESSFQALAIEEKFGLVIQNFLDFERTLNDLALSSLVSMDYEWSAFIDSIQLVNRQLVNLLSTCRLYVDHIPQHLNSLFGPSAAQAAKFTDATSKEYDSSLGYRVMYALRNYVQHSGFPVHSLKIGGGWLEPLKPSKSRHMVNAFVSIAELEKEPQFKKTVLEELKALGPTVDIKQMVRQNHSSFSRLHAYVRTLISPDLKQWDALLESTLVQWKSTHGEATGLSVVEVDDKNHIVAEHSIFDDMIKRRRYLASKNMTVTNMELHYVSSESGV